MHQVPRSQNVEQDPF